MRLQFLLVLPFHQSSRRQGGVDEPARAILVLFDAKECSDGSAARVHLGLVRKGRNTAVNSVVRFVEHVGDGVVGIVDKRVQEILVEVLPTPLRSLLAGVSAETVSVSLRGCGIDLLEHGEVPLSTNTSIVIDEAVRVLHHSSAALIPVLADTDTEAEVRVVLVRTLGRGGSHGGRVSVKSLPGQFTVQRGRRWQRTP